MSKRNLRYGYETIKCPVCKAKTFDYCSYSEFGWGIVEQHGCCLRWAMLLNKHIRQLWTVFGHKKGFQKWIR